MGPEIIERRNGNNPMCLVLDQQLRKSDYGAELFKLRTQYTQPNYNSSNSYNLVRLFKMLTYNSDTGRYTSPIYGTPAELETVIHSDRDRLYLNSDELQLGCVYRGLHLSLFPECVPYCGRRSRRVNAIVHMDDFVASDGYDAVFMKAIYTPITLNENMEKYAKMLKEV